MSHQQHGSKLQRQGRPATTVAAVGCALLVLCVWRRGGGPRAPAQHGACFSHSPAEALIDTSRPPPPAEWALGGPVTPQSGAEQSQARFLARVRDLGFSPACILDVGANEGTWAQMAASVFNASAPTILCVEGSKHRAEALRRKGAAHVITVVGAAAGHVPFFDKADAHTGNSVLRENTQYFKDVAPVLAPVRTLDQVVRAYERQAATQVRPALVKVDVQGFELEVLKGAPSVLASAEVVLLETSLLPYNQDAPLVGEVVSAMHCLGFMVLDMIETHYVAGTLFQIDWAFVRRTSPLVRASYAAQKHWLTLGQ